MYVSLFSKQNAGNKTVANMHMTHSRCPDPELKSFGVTASVDVHPCFSLRDFHTSGDHGAMCPAPIDGSVAPIV